MICMEDYGAIIKRLRKSKNMTQADCAEKAKISLMSFRRYESGEREPTIGTLKDISFALGVPVTELIGVATTSQNEYDIAQYVHDFPGSHISRILPEDAELYEIAQRLPRPEVLPEDMQILKDAMNRLGYNIEKVNGRYSFIGDHGGYEVTEEEIKQLEKQTSDFLKFQCQQLEEKHTPDFLKKKDSDKDPEGAPPADK